MKKKKEILLKYLNILILIVLSYTITSIDSKSYLGVIEGYNIPFSRVIREIKELNTTEKEKVLKANTKLKYLFVTNINLTLERELNYYKEQQKPIVGDLSLFTFLLEVKVKEILKKNIINLSKPREGPIGNKANSLE
ncbi:uncharacterized protein LY79DRAFT_585060 [Colletotrichum navitas]|uniref:Uncharacterized protein n=1 Tax=Colletotrichum navitas TaxID=681940 RepID=A0AAD8PJR1_9PEZI|nr:uncharacterized protein LY79DRAFT_585060 [Colletotrichum navitas]KAK1566018.1 hypothetical protein LY79DRAFT_585060 [Colletotrichum navitas]